MARIDLSGAPPDFAEPFRRHVAATAELAQLLERSPSPDRDRALEAVQGRLDQAMMDWSAVGDRFGAYPIPTHAAEQAALIRDNLPNPALDAAAADRLATQLRSAERLRGREQEEALRAIDQDSPPAELRHALRIYIHELGGASGLEEMFAAHPSHSPDTSRVRAGVLDRNALTLEEARAFLERSALAADVPALGLLRAH